MFEFATVAGITVICFLAAELVKATPLNDKWLPIFCGVLGACLGVLGWHVMPGFPADNVINAIAVGISSGLAATGSHQIYKQLSKGGE